MYSWSGHQRPAWRTRVRTRSSLIGSTRRRHAERLAQAVERLRQPRAVGQPRRALHAHREVAVAEVEPDVLAQLAQPLHHLEGVAPQAPAALVDPVGQPVEDEVGIGGDVGAVDLDVVGGVGDRRRARRRPRRASRGRAWPRPSRRRGRLLRPSGHRSSGRPGDAHPGVSLVAGVDRDQQRGQRLDDARHLQAPGIHAAQPGDPPDDLARRARLSALRSPQISTSSSSSWSRSESVEALTVCSARDDAHALRRHLRRLLRRPSPAGRRARAWPCRPRRRRAGTVASTRSWPGLSDRREVRRGSPTGCGTGRTGRRSPPRCAASGFSTPSNVPAGHPLRRLGRRFGRALGVARADRPPARPRGPAAARGRSPARRCRR